MTLLTRELHHQSTWRLNAAMTAGGIVLLAAVLALSATRSNAAEMIVRNTVRLSLTWYAAALLLMMTLRPRDWSAETLCGRITRWCWSWALVCFLIHLCMAFNYYHHWSHTHAFEHTRNVSGVGAGIFSLYFFVAFGLADVAWWWARPQRYAARSPVIDRILHSFMLFIVFNGMVIFESGPVRWAGLAMFTIFAAAWLYTRGASRAAPA